MGRGEVPAGRRRVDQLRDGRGARHHSEPSEGGRQGVRLGGREGQPRASDRVQRGGHRRGDEDGAGSDGQRRQAQHPRAEERVRNAQPQDDRQRGAAPAVVREHHHEPRAHHRDFPASLTRTAGRYSLMSGAVLEGFTPSI